MSSCQMYNSPHEGGCGAEVNLVEDPMVIARFPDIVRDGDRKKAKPSDGGTIKTSLLRRGDLRKKAAWVAGAMLVLIAVWMFFTSGGSETSESGSWRPAPPAASAPATPLWDGDVAAKAVVAAETSRSGTASIKLDEVLPRRVSREKPAAADLSNMHNMQSNPDQTLVGAAPKNPENSADNIPDWASLSDAEYYWAVRRRSEEASYRTASKPETDLASQESGEGRSDAKEPPMRQRSDVHLNGVIETPSVRVY